MIKKITKKYKSVSIPHFMRSADRIFSDYARADYLMKHAFECLESSGVSASEMRLYSKDVEAVVKCVLAAFHYKLRSNKKRQAFFVSRAFTICEELLMRSSCKIFDYRNNVGLFMILLRRVKLSERALKPKKGKKEGIVSSFDVLNKHLNVGYLFSNMEKFVG